MTERKRKVYRYKPSLSRHLVGKKHENSRSTMSSAFPSRLFKYSQNGLFMNNQKIQGLGKDGKTLDKSFDPKLISTKGKFIMESIHNFWHHFLTI